MKNNIENLQLIINKKKTFFLALIGFGVIFLLPLIGTLIGFLVNPLSIRNINTYFLLIILEGFFLFLGIPILRRYIKENYPIYIMVFTINEEKIEIMINCIIYYKELWRNIKKIEVINEKSFIQQAKYLYKLRFFTENDIREFRLYVLMIEVKKQQEIVEMLKRIATMYEIDIQSMHQKHYNQHIFKQEVANERFLIREFKKKLN